VSSNPYLEQVARYRADPIAFVREVLGTEPDPWQAEFLTALARGDRRISVVSGHGTGKSTAASFGIIWFACTRTPFKVVITAPTAGQLFDALFAELKAWIDKMHPGFKVLFDVKSDRIELIASRHDSFIVAKTSRAETPEAMAGVHSENVLLIADEASGVPEQVFEAAAGSMSGDNATTVLLGNPVRSTGYFYETHHKLKDHWTTMAVSCLTSPRVSKQWIEEMQVRYGEESNAYRVRVLGKFPLGDDDTIIPMDLIASAQGRDIANAPGTGILWGVDVARFGSDSSAVAKRQGRILLEPVTLYRGLDLMQLCGRIKAEYDATDPKRRPVEILIDVIGMGSGVVDRLRELGLPARGINVSEAPAIGITYGNLRAELWFKARAWFAGRDVAIPVKRPEMTPTEAESLDRLVNELAAVRFQVKDSSGKIYAESKADMKKRGVASPDAADAFVLTFAGDAVTALHGKDSQRNWNKPLRRNLKGIV
jgi:phage terminase large subunit